MSDTSGERGSVPCSGTVRLKSPQVDITLDECWVALGAKEVLVRADVELPVGTLVRFALSVDRDGELISGLARVAWRRAPEGEREAALGLVLIKTDEKSRAVIEEIVGAPREGGGDGGEGGAGRDALLPPPSPAPPGAPPARVDPRWERWGDAPASAPDLSAWDGDEKADPARDSRGWTDAVARAAGVGDGAPPHALPHAVSSPDAETLPPPVSPPRRPLSAASREAETDPGAGSARASARSGTPAPISTRQSFEPLAVLTADAKGRLLAWSPGAEALLGYRAEEVVGRHVAELMPERFRADFVAGLGLYMATFGEERNRRSVQGTALRKDGRELLIDLCLGHWVAQGKSFWSALLVEASSDRISSPPGVITDELPPLLDGKYRLVEEIGRGGMGVVFRAHDSSLDRAVAIKFLLPEHGSRPELVERFRREARAMAAVRQHNVLQIFASGRYRNTDYFVMEYVRGATAAELLAASQLRGELLALRDVLWLADQAAAGLIAVHRAGAVHRDIKPGNLMVQRDPRRVVIMDFGIARQVVSRDLKRTPEPFGTPTYMPPELIAGNTAPREEEHLVDIYAMGVTLFELITGRPPFAGKNWVEVFQRHLTEQPAPPSSLRAAVPKALDQVVLRCLAKDPRDRFESAEALREALSPLLYAAEGNQATPDHPEPVVERKPAQPRPSAVPSDRPRPPRYPGARVLFAGGDVALRALVAECARDAIPGSRFWSAPSSLAALAMARSAPPMVLVAPLSDPEMNGIELAAAIRGDRELEAVQLVLLAGRVPRADRAILESMGVTLILEAPYASGVVTAALARAAEVSRR